MGKLWGYLAVSALAACGVIVALLYIRGADQASGPVWSGPEIRIGYSSEAPYSFRAKDGDVTGQSPEIAKAVLEKIGVGPIRWVLLDFGKAIPELLAGRIDMIANGLFITPYRAAKVLFSLPYSRVLPGLLVRRGNPRDLHSYAEVARKVDVTAAVLDGSVEQAELTALGMPPRRLFVVPDPMAGLAAVRAGRADCLALSSPTVSWFAHQSPDEVAVAEPFYEAPDAVPGESAFAFRAADRDLADRVNAALRSYIGTPEHEKRVEMFGFGPHSLPAWSRP
ncbi:extracellular solute-binding protein family 3 [Solidesulfovibrio fructosivorans JJ]]|uniref:Extracellular solute-binding protein family 3 n=1 Tax=Solidesulfovibrio fructosivorans JJ] TaxID=596151 RepID=E1JW40_SOLFR|nr:ectoine/hydroxyectoine ABC transporter substrate-binding protein EhuB [Solidesulfovibrio fructosivorans]EFL51400.1 extracellular solute-binding protein family 3 [Solidesulfovibrio fructosivorans JJ]]